MIFASRRHIYYCNYIAYPYILRNHPRYSTALLHRSVCPSVGPRPTSRESHTSHISGSTWRLHPSTKPLASERMEIILSAMTVLFHRHRLPRSKSDVFNDSLIWFNASARFIDSQLQLEADAREALPYVGASPSPH